MTSGPPTLFLSADHLTVVGITVTGNVLLCRRARRDPAAAWIPWFRRGLAALLLANAAWAHAWLAASGQWDARWALNCQLCDAALFACVVALLRPSAIAFELACFWGLGATLQGLVTPAITERFPDPAFVQFFVMHAGVVTAASFLAFGLGMNPRPGVVLRMMLWTNGFALVAGLACWLTGGNYMFLREPPPTGSLLDVLGRWPWYLVWAEGVALGFFSLVAVPFVLRARGR
jgi:hypothetical integral membrane protein (TIGR02206 family)